MSSSYNPSRVKKTEIKNNIEDSDEEEDKNKNKKKKEKKEESDEEEYKPKAKKTIASVPLKPLASKPPTNNDDDFKEVIEEVAPVFKPTNTTSNDPFSFFEPQQTTTNTTQSPAIDFFATSSVQSSSGPNNCYTSSSVPDIFSAFTAPTSQPPKTSTSSPLGKSYL